MRLGPRRPSTLSRRRNRLWGDSAEFMAACREDRSVDQDDIAAPDAVFRLAECVGDIAGYDSLVRLYALEFERVALVVEP